MLSLGFVAAFIFIARELICALVAFRWRPVGFVCSGPRSSAVNKVHIAGAMGSMWLRKGKKACDFTAFVVFRVLDEEALEAKGAM